MSGLHGVGGKGNVELFAPGGLENHLHRIASGGVYGLSEAKFPNVSQAFVGYVGHHDEAAAAGFENSGVHQPDGAGAKDQGAVARLRVQIFLTVEAAGERFHQRGALQRHTGRDRDDVPLGYRRRGDLNVLGEPAGVIVPESGEGVAKIVLLSPAVDALSATNHGGDDDVHADRDFGVHTGAGLGHVSNDFVSRNSRRNNVLLSVGEDALVRATHRAAPHSQNDLTRSRRGPRYSLHSHVAWPVIDCSFHPPSRLSFFGWRLPVAAVPEAIWACLPATSVELPIISVALVFTYSGYAINSTQRRPSRSAQRHTAGFNAHVCSMIEHAITFRQTRG